MKIISFSFFILLLCFGSGFATSEEVNLYNENRGDDMKKAIFAGGCFWCMEPPFAQTEGVASVIPGYTGGAKKDPTYEEVSSGDTGHLEAVEITYDPSKVSYSELLEVFWKNIDPTDNMGQFADKGPQYKTAIFYSTDEEKRLAEDSRARMERSGKFDKPIATIISKASKFYPAEEYHREYYKKRPIQYGLYKEGSGRAGFLKKIWGKPESGAAKKDLKKKLTPMQYDVTQSCGTEPPFQNEYWDNKRDGIYVDIVSGEVLFSSKDKFDSGTGWPSFTKPLEPENIVEKKDYKLAEERTEVRSKGGDSHLGHVFNDGPVPTGIRYCINSASLRFIPKEDLREEGYGEYGKLFE